jgi:hypothetical protein
MTTLSLTERGGDLTLTGRPLRLGPALGGKGDG